MLRYQVEKSFKEQKGKTYCPTPLTYLRNNQKVQRVTWAREMKNMVGKEKALVFFLDKSGFIPLGTEEG